MTDERKETIKRVLKDSVILLGFYIVIFLILISGLFLGQQNTLHGNGNDTIILEKEAEEEPEEFLHIEPDSGVFRELRPVTPMEEVKKTVRITMK